MAAIPLFKKPASADVAARVDVEKAKARLADMNAEELDSKIAAAKPYTKAYGDFVKENPQHVDKLKAYWEKNVDKAGGRTRKLRKHRKVRKHRKTRKH